MICSISLTGSLLLIWEILKISAEHEYFHRKKRIFRNVADLLTDKLTYVSNAILFQP